MAWLIRVCLFWAVERGSSTGKYYWQHKPTSLQVGSSLKAKFMTNSEREDYQYCLCHNREKEIHKLHWLCNICIILGGI